MEILALTMEAAAIQTHRPMMKETRRGPVPYQVLSERKAQVNHTGIRSFLCHSKYHLCIARLATHEWWSGPIVHLHQMSKLTICALMGEMALTAILAWNALYALHSGNE
jgi:hypothetical protein